MTSAHLWQRHECLLTTLLVRIGEVRVPVLEPTHFLQLLLDPSAHLHRVGEILFGFFFTDFPVRVQQLDQPGDDLAYRFLVASTQMTAEVEVPFGVVDIALLTEFPEDLGKVVGDNAKSDRCRRRRMFFGTSQPGM